MYTNLSTNTSEARQNNIQQIDLVFWRLRHDTKDDVTPD